MLTEQNLLSDDKSPWVDNYCIMPFNQIMVTETGDLYGCWCDAYVPKVIGNILDYNSWEDFEKVFLDNPVRNSILDRSYRYCVGTLCPMLQEKMSGKNPWAFVSYEKVQKISLSMLRLSLDRSCNLKCPTCRNDVLIQSDKQFLYSLKEKLDHLDKIFFNPLKVKEIFMEGSGEFLASKLLFSWMQDKAKSGVKFWLQSNGTLISQYKDKLEDILASTHTINISLDGSCKEVFENVRRGGNWEKTLEGLHILNDLRKKYGFTIGYNFTISSTNYFDIPNFIEFCKLMKPNGIYMSHVIRWGHMSDEQWKNFNIFEPTHPKYKNLREILNNLEIPSNMSFNFAHKL